MSEAQNATANLVRSLPEAHVGVVRAQQAQFMEQVGELQRVSDIQESSSQEWRAQAEEDSPTRGKGAWEVEEKPVKGGGSSNNGFGLS